MPRHECKTETYTGTVYEVSVTRTLVKNSERHLKYAEDDLEKGPADWKHPSVR